MCILCERGSEPSHENYTETTGDDFSWMTTVNRGRGKTCDECYGFLRPYPIYLGEKYEIAKSGGAPKKFASHSKSMTSKAFHADFGCHRFTLDSIKQSSFINHFKGKEDRIINGLEVLRDIAAPESAEWINLLISSADYSDLIVRLQNVQTADIAGAITDEILEKLSYQPPTSNLEIGCIVEIIGGAFKGEKARVISVAETQEEASMELYEQPIPMTIQMRVEHVHVIERVE